VLLGPPSPVPFESAVRGEPDAILVGALHLVHGVGADVLLGAKIPDAAISDPTLDSQNRFYGVSFTLSGVLLLLCASDIPRYATVLRCVLWVFFAAGIARLVSIAIYGFPSAPVVALLAVELVVPPTLVWWLSRVGRRAAS
jgi:hypothetical protein